MWDRDFTISQHVDVCLVPSVLGANDSGMDVFCKFGLDPDSPSQGFHFDRVSIAYPGTSCRFGMNLDERFRHFFS